MSRRALCPAVCVCAPAKAVAFRRWTARRHPGKRRRLRVVPSRACGHIAELVEQLTLNQRVQGSSPCAPTNEIKDLANMTPEHTGTVGCSNGFASRLSDRIVPESGIACETVPMKDRVRVSERKSRDVCDLSLCSADEREARHCGTTKVVEPAARPCQMCGPGYFFLTGISCWRSKYRSSFPARCKKLLKCCRPPKRQPIGS